MKYASEKHEKMEQRVGVPFLLEKVINKRAHGVCNSAREQKDNCAVMQSFNSRLPRKDYAPAHNEIAYCREFFVFFDVDRVKNDTDCARGPYNTEYRPTERYVVFANRPYAYGCVGSRDQKKDRAVVKHLKDFL